MIGEVDPAKVAGGFERLLPRLEDLEAGRASGADLVAEILNELASSVKAKADGAISLTAFLFPRLSLDPTRPVPCPACRPVPCLPS